VSLRTVAWGFAAVMALAALSVGNWWGLAGWVAVAMVNVGTWLVRKR
jgi:hypothetical protein